VTFDLVVATIDRVDALERLLASLERQTLSSFRVLVVDQNDDERVQPALEAHSNLDIEHLRTPRGLSRARNAALSRLRAEAVAFPDDDCAFPDDLLERVAARLADPKLDGLTGRAPSPATWKHDGAMLTRDNLWNRAISFTIFLRRDIVERMGAFDESLGLPSSSGEEIDYLVRAIDAGARIEYDPTIVVMHPEKPVDLTAVGARDGASIGYILRKHRYPRRVVARMLLRPAGGIVLDPRRARFHLATFRGRLRGYRAT
jgi:glycosyltransferase involved in cell wall biosynthesis